MFGYKCKNDHVTQDETTDSPEIVCPVCQEDAYWQALSPELGIEKEERQRDADYKANFKAYEPGDIKEVFLYKTTRCITCNANINKGKKYCYICAADVMDKHSLKSTTKYDKKKREEK